MQWSRIARACRGRGRWETKAAVPPGQERWLNLGPPLPEVLQAPEPSGWQRSGRWCLIRGWLHQAPAPQRPAKASGQDQTLRRLSRKQRTARNPLPRAGKGTTGASRGGGILFAAPSSGQERTNSAAAQLCANEIEADTAATCQAALSAAPSTSLLRRGSAPFRETAVFPQAVSR